MDYTELCPAPQELRASLVEAQEQRGAAERLADAATVRAQTAERALSDIQDSLQVTSHTHTRTHNIHTHSIQI
eukprot:COSAG05_NODE_4087_length_1679_cov_1.488608_3_plen_72_part_01